MDDDSTPAAGETRATARIRLADDAGPVTLRKLVSKGERLEIASDEDSVTLDALLLEGLTWQRDRAAVDELLGGDTAVGTDPVAAAGADAPVEPATDTDVSVSNEYAHVAVREVTTGAGRGVELSTPGRGTAIVLGPRSLRALAGVEDTYVFSVWFETPFGPEDTPVEGPL